jgi:hypothetical protein
VQASGASRVWFAIPRPNQPDGRGQDCPARLRWRDITRRREERGCARDNYRPGYIVLTIFLSFRCRVAPLGVRSDGGASRSLLASLGGSEAISRPRGAGFSGLGDGGWRSGQINMRPASASPAGLRRIRQCPGREGFGSSRPSISRGVKLEPYGPGAARMPNEDWFIKPPRLAPAVGHTPAQVVQASTARSLRPGRSRGRHYRLTPFRQSSSLRSPGRPAPQLGPHGRVFLQDAQQPEARLMWLHGPSGCLPIGWWCPRPSGARHSTSAIRCWRSLARLDQRRVGIGSLTSLPALLAAPRPDLAFVELHGPPHARGCPVRSMVTCAARHLMGISGTATRLSLPGRLF